MELHPRTASINKTQKVKSKLARKKALNWLAENFAVFNTISSIQPLSKGIRQDILEHPITQAALKENIISKSKIRQAIVLFTRRIDYLTCIKAQEERRNLEGIPTQFVTEEEAESATVKIKKQIEKSLKNARKGLLTKQPTPYSNSERYTPATTSSSRPAPIITHKNTRQLDPSAIARLKEKLGLIPVTPPELVEDNE